MEYFQRDSMRPGFCTNGYTVIRLNINTCVRDYTTLCEFQAFTMISSPALHSWLLRASQILYDPIKATLPRAPFSFLVLRIPTWLQMNSRLAAFLNNDRVGCYSLWGGDSGWEGGFRIFKCPFIPPASGFSAIGSSYACRYPTASPGPALYKF